jgi:NitT/TauT family transport system ATP-binding protein
MNGEVISGQQHAGSEDPTRNAALVLQNVTKVFRLESGEDFRAVDDVSLTIEPGEFVCVLGPSGHGKSTLLNLIAGFIPPTSGTIWCHGSKVEGPGADRGVIFQRDTVFLWRRVAQNIGYGLKSRGVPKAERDATVDRLLDAVGLKQFARAWPKQLSGGMRRRVAIAAVFANRPSVLLMDEPFTGLDFARRAILYRVLVDLWTDARNTVIFVTHNIDEALALADRILIVLHGRIVFEARVQLPQPREGEALLAPELDEIRRSIHTYLQTAVSALELATEDVSPLHGGGDEA